MTVAMVGDKHADCDEAVFVIADSDSLLSGPEIRELLFEKIKLLENRTASVM